MSDDQVNPIDTTPLRNANPLPDSESESEDEQPQPTRVEQPTPPYQVALQYAQRFGIHTFLFLQLVWVLLSRAASTTQTVSMSLVRSLQSQVYIFFQGSCYPYRAQSITLAGPGIAPVEWYYNADTKVFLSYAVYNSTHEYNTHHLQWLAGEIKYNDLVLYDVSDFLQQVRWAGNQRPSPALVLSAWSIHSGIVLNFRDGLVLKTINEDGTESETPLRG